MCNSGTHVRTTIETGHYDFHVYLYIYTRKWTDSATTVLIYREWCEAWEVVVSDWKQGNIENKDTKQRYLWIYV